MKRIVAVLMFAALLAGGAFAQLMFGVTGDLHIDAKSNLTNQQIIDKFQSGEGIFYGPFAEIVFGKLGIGVAGTFSFYTDTLSTLAFMDYDLTGYLSYHLFGGHAFLDPFVELGGGYIATDYANSSDKPANIGNDPLQANLFWYAAAGLGVNLGPLGVFAKAAYNNVIQSQLDGKYSDGTAYKIAYYLTDANGKPYVPAYRVTIGAKIIL